MFTLLFTHFFKLHDQNVISYLFTFPFKIYKLIHYNKVGNNPKFISILCYFLFKFKIFFQVLRPTSIYYSINFYER